jgi:hypothetical protein
MAASARSEILTSKPIGCGLNAFCESHGTECKDLVGEGSTPHLHIELLTNAKLDNVLLDLVHALQGLPASRHPP